MNRLTYMTMAAVLVITQAQAQVMVQQVQESTSVTHEVPANPYAGAAPMGNPYPVTLPVTTTYTIVETTAVGSAPSVDPGQTATVKLENGSTVQFPDTADKSWQEYAREQGYNRFTFDPASGLFVVGKGDERFGSNWDDDGQRMQAQPAAKPAAKPAVKKAKKKVVEETTAATDGEPASEMPAETSAEKAADTPADTVAPAAASEPAAQPAEAASPSVATPEVSVPASEVHDGEHGAAGHGSGH